jgi:hypothetical protein
MSTLTPVLTTDSVLITWTVAGLGTVPTINNLTNPVIAVTYQCQGQQLKIGSSDVLTATRTGVVSVAPNADSYTAFNDLTEAQVMGWVNRQLGEEGLTEVTQQVIADIYQQQHPKNLPWSN